jgi:predicted membrane channel-forming protein YqfA (hemolysin III family)
MTTVPPGSRPVKVSRPSDPILTEGQQYSYAARALSYIVLLNGAASLIMLSCFAFGLQSTEPKLVAAMLVFGSGALAGLLSSFLTYLNRVVRLEAPERMRIRDGLQIAALIAVIASGAIFLIGLNMVGTATTSRSSTHPKTKLEDRGLALAPPSKEGSVIVTSKGNLAKA